MTMERKSSAVNTRRRYDSSGRRERARQAREQIAGIAGIAEELFLSRGYAAITVAAIAARARVSAETIYKSFGVAAASPVHSSGFGAAVATAPPVTLILAPATLPLPEIIARLNAAQPPALLGYASKLAEVAREQLAGRLRIAPRSVTSVAELLTPADRAVIERAFAMPVINAFVSTEALVGHSEPGGPVLRFASDL
jgi:phenylacetate-coenzyme A ligase PaaK-like adenylate-forming protein